MKMPKTKSTCKYCKNWVCYAEGISKYCACDGENPHRDCPFKIKNENYSGAGTNLNQKTKQERLND